MKHFDAALDDPFTRSSGSVFMSGLQALVRLPLIQIARDKAAGLNTGGFISGYRGSPLGGYDQALQRAHKLLDANGIVVRPAVNEELAATAIWGSQQLHLSPGAAKDGVFGIWYGKGPGVDRSGDVLKHGNAAGSAPHGGVLCLAGDDHSAKSSSIPHQSDHAFMSALMPVLYPSTVHEFVRMGLIGIAMSRYSGCWVGMKVIADTVETSATVDLGLEALQLSSPIDFELPPGGLNLRWPDDRWTQDHRLQTSKGYAAIAFARANGVDRVAMDAKRARYGIVASGKAFEGVREALNLLGIDAAMAEALGLRLLKIGMPWPLEPVRVRAFSEGLEEVLVVEERREIIEYQIKQHLFNWRSDVRPRIVGKFDEHEVPCLPLDHELSADIIAETLVARLLRLEMPEGFHTHIERRLKELRARHVALQSVVAPLARLPHYCPGCPHNTSTRVPEGSRALAGIGCHFMAQWMDRRTGAFTQMGGEGVPWVGTAPFTTERHIFANLGDGTYFHSGILAIRQSIAAGVNITYKILFNGAVAMTGGQPVDGQLTVPQLSHQLRDEGIQTIYLLSDDPDRHPPALLAPGVIVDTRDAIDRVMDTLRQLPGCTAIIYDQSCATELRRKRSRGLAPKAEERVYINPAVCEGCGDCSTQSNCIAIDPLETAFGRKRAINQSACNSDLSCLKGFCPSFVTVKGGAVRKGNGIGLPDKPLPDPIPVEEGGRSSPYNIAVAGVGGTGVLTVGHLLGMAAHIDGLGATVLDMAGLAQKGGAVISHIRLSLDPDLVLAPKTPTGEADLLLAPDMVVATSPDCANLLSSVRTNVVIDTHITPVADFVRDRDFDFQSARCLKQIARMTRAGATRIDFNALAIKVLGDAIAVNMMMVGAAYQRGLLPVSEAALRRATELNGVAVAFNLQAFAWGRYAAAYPDECASLLDGNRAGSPRAEMSLDALIAHRIAHLTAYQHRAWAQKYVAAVTQIRALEERVTGTETLTRAVAINYAKVLSYKDEYEIARLFNAPEFSKELDATFDGKISLAFHLAPPLLARFDENLGRPRKIALGGWMLPAFRLLARLKCLRGTRFDPFGATTERRLERALIKTYEEGLAKISLQLSGQNQAAAVALASAPDMVRGFGPVKLAALKRFDQQWRERLADMDFGPAPARAGESAGV
ncbi:MAG TPA: indolepyruvate ferredoxin oxidoreductase family protein [Magnetospirillaceae bacterium]|jgi:indolepyruvate ferredoxin oxidoreductase